MLPSRPVPTASSFHSLQNCTVSSSHCPFKTLYISRGYPLSRLYASLGSFDILACSVTCRDTAIDWFAMFHYIAASYSTLNWTRLWPNAELCFIEPMGTNLNEIGIKIQRLLLVCHFIPVMMCWTFTDNLVPIVCANTVHKQCKNVYRFHIAINCPNNILGCFTIYKKTSTESWISTKKRQLRSIPDSLK